MYNITILRKSGFDIKIDVYKNARKSYFLSSKESHPVSGEFP